MNPPVIELENLRFDWSSEAAGLRIEQLRIDAGESVFIHGPSGCGKSTLLSLMAGVLLRQQGRVTLHGQDWHGLGLIGRDRHRVNHVGYIFQQFNLLPYLSVLDNVLLPCRFSPLRRAAARQQFGSEQREAESWLAGMGIDSPLWRRPASRLSVGQQQRVAAARAMIGQPSLVLADEPTSSLDESLRDAFLDRLLPACAAAGSALVLVSHDTRIAARFSRCISLPEINRAAAQTEATT
ncbi:MAG: methionine ABC transporter ATP-binding protein [Lautropia sp. SCN 66-9]|nr:MAG: methionine ABC transporter ATP-binding protein [Lautropia sp. SCN 66-9]